MVPLRFLSRLDESESSGIGVSFKLDLLANSIARLVVGVATSPLRGEWWTEPFSAVARDGSLRPPHIETAVFISIGGACEFLCDAVQATHLVRLLWSRPIQLRR